MNEIMKKLPSLGMGKANVDLSISCIEKFKREVLSKEIPNDLLDFFVSLNSKNMIETLRWSPGLWEGEYLQTSFIDVWDFDSEVFDRAKKNLCEILKDVGLALKHYFAWQVISNILGNRGKWHPELLLESVDDLRCSIFLAKEHFFKQALQVLRNYCEICVAMLYFAMNENAFVGWYEDKNNYHVPDFRNEMLKELESVLDITEIDFLTKRYRELNHSVHSKRRRLNWNLSSYRIERNDFREEELSEWSRKFIRILHFALKLYLKNLFV